MLNNTVVLVYSEFGRRISENGSAGTDHGAGGNMMLLGGLVRGGIYGTAPSLSLDPANPTLENNAGDVKWETDFRGVYAKILDGWLGSNSISVLGALGGLQVLIAVVGLLLVGVYPRTVLSLFWPYGLFVAWMFGRSVVAWPFQGGPDQGALQNGMAYTLFGIEFLLGATVAAGERRVALTLPGDMPSGLYFVNVNTGVGSVARQFLLTR
jgi:hypothetical protein